MHGEHGKIRNFSQKQVFTSSGRTGSCCEAEHLGGLGVDDEIELARASTKLLP
jgi:hypothetical protein